MTLNGVGFGIQIVFCTLVPSTVIQEKKEPQLQQMNLSVLKQLKPDQVKVEVCLVELPKQPDKPESEIVEMDRYVSKKGKELRFI